MQCLLTLAKLKDLEKAAAEYDKKLNYYEWVSDGLAITAFKAGAEWQKQRDKEGMGAKEKECNDIRNDGFDAFMDGFNKGYELGIKEQTKKQ